MSRRAAAAALSALALTVGAGCSDAPVDARTAADLDAVDLHPDHRVVVDEDGFSPTRLEVGAGEVVLLVNEGDEEHTFTADDATFDTGRVQPGEDVTLVLVTPGEVAYRDATDPDHAGTVVVTPPEGQ